MDQEIIPEIPDIPPEIIEAVNNNKQLAIFFGAGLSRLLGCPSWKQLAEKLIERCSITTRRNNSQLFCINYKEKKLLFSEINSPKKIITICQDILFKNDTRDAYYDELRIALSPNPDIYKELPIFDELFKLNCLFVTTNIDVIFDNKFKRQRIAIQKQDFDPSNIDNSKLYHIHGSISDPDSVVLTVKEYFERYRPSQFRAFLRMLFNEYTVLFIGYGLNELEILEFLMNSLEDAPSPAKPRFILLPYDSGQVEKVEFDKLYYNQLRISVISYNIDKFGEKQILEVLKEWNKRIFQISTALYDTIEEITQAANKYDSIKAEKIFQYIEDSESLKMEFFRQLAKSENPNPWLIPLKENDYFNPKNNPVDEKGRNSFWPAMWYLEKIAKINSHNYSSEITKEIISIINPIIYYKNDSGERTVNILTDQHIVRIAFLLPLEYIIDDYYSFVRTCLRSQYDNIFISNEIKELIVPRFCKEKSKESVLKILDIIFDYKKSETPSFEDYPSLIDSYQLGEVLKKYSNQIFEIAGNEAIEIAKTKIEQIVTDDPSQFNEVWIPSIDVEDERERFDSKLVHFIWVGLGLLNHSERNREAIDLLNKDHPIFKRIGLCLIDHHYSEIKELFWNWKGNPMDNIYLKYEIHQILKHHSKEFSAKEISTVIEWIETNSYFVEYIENPIEKNKVLAYEKKGWLSSLLDSGNSEIINLYQKYDQENPFELRHPERNFVIEHLSGTESPITKEEILSKSNLELVGFLNNFKEEGRGWNRISSHALCNTFEGAVIDDPIKFISDIHPLLSLKRQYQYALIRGFSEAWKKEKDFDWINIFEFVEIILDSSEFWTEEYDEGRSNYRNWIIGEIASLIEEGTNNDPHTFDLPLLPRAERILLLLSEKSQSDLYDMGDLVDSVLNSDKGKIFSAMINLSLLQARRYRKDVTPRWVGPIKQYFIERLDPEKEKSLEFWSTLGKYLPNFCYLDKGWVVKNIDKVFPKDYDEYWIAGFSSYLFYSSVYIKLYNLLKKQGHYSKAINTNFKGHHINERLIQHICIGYLYDLESFEDSTSLINKLFELWNPTQIKELIRFCWSLNRELPNEKKTKIFELWRKLYSNILKDPESSENHETLSELADWIIYIDEINEESFEWLKASAKYLKFHDFNFIESLTLLIEKTPRYTGTIFLDMIKSGHIFAYKQEEIINFVTLLFEKDEKEIADSICNIYLGLGYDFLKEIFRKYSKH